MTRMSRRALLLSGAGAVTVAPLVTFAEAEAGTRVSRTFTGAFTQTNTPDWHYLPFRVPRGVHQISVSYDFTPTDTGFGFSYNVVDIGIFDPSGHGLGNAQGFRGWSGGARRHFKINRHWATPGYLAGPITNGVWAVALGPYQIIPPGTPWKVVVTLHYGPGDPPFEWMAAPQSVPGTSHGWYRGDFHTHTVHSDGKRTPAQMVVAAQRAGLDFIGTSEHNTSSAQRRYGPATPPGFLVIHGEEVTTRAGHWVATGLPPGTWIDWRYRPADNQLPRFAELVRSLGGLAIVAHPNVPVPSIQWDFGADYAHMDAVEVWNASWGYEDEAALENWHQLLVEGRFVPAVGDSDSHGFGDPVGTAQTVVLAENLSSRAIVSGVRAGRCWLAENSTPQLSFTAAFGGSSYSLGDTVPTSASDVVPLTLAASAVPGTLAQMIGASGVLAGAFATSDGTVTLTAQAPAAERFARVEIRRPQQGTTDPTSGSVGGVMVAMTNPIFLA